jgi:growth arrest-specific protein 8
MKNHEAAFGEMREYYQGITADNCGLIQRYEAELADLRTNQLRNADLLTAAENENGRLRDPLAAIMAEVSQLRASLSEVEKIKLMLRNATGRLKDSGRRRDAEVRAVAKLKQRLGDCEKRRESLYKDFETTILDLQSKTDRKNLMLAKRLDGYEAEAEGCEAKIEQMVTAMELDKSEVLDVLRHTAAAVNEVDHEAEQAEFAIARGVKVFNETLRAFQEKMQSLGIPEDEVGSIGFELLPEPEGGASTQPSGLIAAPFNASQSVGSVTQRFNHSQSIAASAY